MQMILPAVHQLVHIVQQDNISGSNLLHLLHSKVPLPPLPTSAMDGHLRAEKHTVKTSKVTYIASRL